MITLLTESMRGHGTDTEFSNIFVNEWEEKANANLMDIYCDISVFEQEILMGLIWFKIIKSKDLWRHMISWSHTNKFARWSDKFSIQVSVFLKQKAYISTSPTPVK